MQDAAPDGEALAGVLAESEAALSGEGGRSRRRDGDTPCPACQIHGRRHQHPHEGAHYPAPFCRCDYGQRKQDHFQRLLLDRFERAGVPDRLKRTDDGRVCSLDTWLEVLGARRPSDLEGGHREAYRSVVDFLRSGFTGYRGRRRDGLMLHGVPGTGKSGLLAALAGHLYAQGHVVLWIEYAQLVDDIQDCYGSGDQEATARLLAAQRASHLFLDEVGDPYARGERYQLSEDKRSIFYDVVSKRHGQRLPTFMTSNYAQMEDLADQFDPRVESRARELCRVVRLDGDGLDLRPAAS